MNAKTKPTVDASREAPHKEGVPETVTAVLANMLHRNIQTFVALHKTTLDALGAQSAEMTDVIRRSFKFGSAVPGGAVLDAAEESVQAWIGAQSDILDLFEEQSVCAVETARKRSDLASQSMAEFGDFARQTAERTIAAQKVMLEFAAKQNRTAGEIFRRYAGVKNLPVQDLADSVERGIDTFVDIQKEYLDSASKAARHSTGA